MQTWDLTTVRQEWPKKWQICILHLENDKSISGSQDDFMSRQCCVLMKLQFTRGPFRDSKIKCKNAGDGKEWVWEMNHCLEDTTVIDKVGTIINSKFHKITFRCGIIYKVGPS